MVNQLTTIDQMVVQHGNQPEQSLPPIIMERGEGAMMWDVEGNDYFDAHASAWLNGIGHGRIEMAECAYEQIRKLEHFTTRREFSSVPVIELSERLIDLSPLDAGKVRYSSSGSQANDDALQVIRAYFNAIGKSEKRTIITLTGAFHGNTFAGLALNGTIGGGKQPFNVVHISMPPAGAGDEICALAAPQELEDVIEYVGASNIAALFGEPVFGSTGMYAPPGGYWTAILDVLRGHDILFVADEVVSAFGRSGSWFASSQFGIVPDIIVTAKGIASGYAPIAAVLLSQQIAEATRSYPGGGSYSGHTLSAALALKNISILESEDLVTAASIRGAQLLTELEPLRELDMIQKVSGVGMMAGIHLDHRFVEQHPLLDYDLVKSAGIITMLLGDVLEITPPFIVTPQQINELVQRIAEGLRIASISVKG